MKGLALLLTTNMAEFVRPAVFTFVRCWIVQVKVATCLVIHLKDDTVQIEDYDG